MPATVQRIVLATANEDKAREIVDIVAAACGGAVVLLPRPPEVPEVDETGDTLEENALLKAAALAAATGLPALADDTGLEVEALGGAPGVRSSRYSGEHATYADNVAKLLAELDGIEQRGARFRTVAALVAPGGEPLLAEGAVDGEITTRARGTGGFGYDPVFAPAGAGGRTFAEMDTAEKNSWSHRGRAFRAMATLLAAR